MKIEILAVTPKAEELIEKAGRTCYRSETKIDESSHKDFIRMIIRSGHLSVLEHASVTIRLSEISRALTHQLVRHRICSYSQQSQRYVKEDGFGYSIPRAIEDNAKAKELFEKTVEDIRAGYKELIDSGIKKEDARYLLPNACHTEIVFSTNFRELRHIILLRGHKAAQWEIREVFIGILKEMQMIAPSCFDDMKIDEEKRVIASDIETISHG